jgi:hypothetical protein
MVDQLRPCSGACPDRETFLSALVIIGNARQFGRVRVPSRIDGEYSPPARETWDALVTELLARSGADAELEELSRLKQRDDDAGDDDAPPEERPATRLAPPPADEPEGDDRT